MAPDAGLHPGQFAFAFAVRSAPDDRQERSERGEKDERLHRHEQRRRSSRDDQKNRRIGQQPISSAMAAHATTPRLSQRNSARTGPDPFDDFRAVETNGATREGYSGQVGHTFG